MRAPRTRAAQGAPLASVGGPPPLLAARDLVKHFPLRRGGLLGRSAGVLRAVDGISFELAAGEALGLVGETGCGKSTTARLLMRLLEPTAGEIAFEGQSLTALRGARLKAARRHIQMVFQDPFSSLNPRRTIGTIIAEPLVVHRLVPDRGERVRRVASLMESVGLDPRQRDRYPHELSGGQRQRVGLARALALEPKLLIADEPVSAVDVSVQAQLLNLLRDLQERFGLALLLISHDLAVVRHMCDRVAVMYLGKIVELAGAEDLYAHPRHPYTGALIASVPVTDPALRRRARPVLSGDPPSPADPPSGCRFRTRCPKARERCAAVEPPLAEPGEAGHRVACHYPLSAGEVAALSVRQAASA